MRRKDFLILLAATVVLVGAIGAILLNNDSKTASEACATTGTSHTVVIQNDTMSPSEINAKRCDTLTIVNRDDVTREIGFGDHEKHVPYNGVAQKILRQDESLTITLVKTGHYHFHDHFHDEVEGEFNVN